MMSGSINFQINKLTSALTFNYNPGESPARPEVPTKSGQEVVNYSQLNKANVRKCKLTGKGALTNLGNQMPDHLGNPKSSSSRSDDEFSEEASNRRESHPRHRNAGSRINDWSSHEESNTRPRNAFLRDEYWNDEDRHNRHRNARYFDRRESRHYPGHHSSSTTERETSTYRECLHSRRNVPNIVSEKPNRMNTNRHDDSDRRGKVNFHKSFGGKETPDFQEYSSSTREPEIEKSRKDKFLDCNEEPWVRTVRETSPERGVRARKNYPTDLGGWDRKYTDFPSNFHLFRDADCDDKTSFW